MQYKIIVLDIDGTLTNSKKEITPKTKECLINMQKKGYTLVLASGRPTYGIVPLAKELEMHNYNGHILSYNGAQIINYSTNEILYSNNLPDDIIEPLYKKSKEHNSTILTYKNEYIITENASCEYVQYEGFLNKMQIKQVDNFLDHISEPIVKCLAVAHEDITVELENKLKSDHADTINIYRSEPFFLELVPQNIDKAYSLNMLLEKLEMNKNEMIAFGDGFNDLSMIEFAGLGVAMANAQNIVKEKANATTLSNEEDGIAHFLESHLGL